MSSSAPMLAVSLRHGWSEYWAAQSPRVLSTVVLPRVVFQSFFFVLLAGLAGDRGSMEFAYVGATAYAMTLPAFHYAGLRYGTERWQGTLVHLSLARLPAAGIHLAKCWMQVAEGLVYAFAVVIVAGMVFDLTSISVQLLQAAFVYPVMALSLLTFGAALVVLTPKGQELLSLNTANAFMLVFAGVVLPPASLPGGGWIANVLPMGNGLEALRSSLGGGPVLAGVLAESAVAAAWLVVAVILHEVVGWLQRRTGRGSLLY